MKWLLAGASGFLGTALRVRLASEGHYVVRLVRREPATATEFHWDPSAGDVTRPPSRSGHGRQPRRGRIALPAAWTTPAASHPVLPDRHDRHHGHGPWPRAPVASGRSSSQAERHRPIRPTVAGEHPHTEDSPAAPDFAAQASVQLGSGRRPGGRGRRPGGLPSDRPGPGPQRPLRSGRCLAWSRGLGATLGDGRSGCR